MFIAPAVISILCSKYLLPGIISFLGNNFKTILNYRGKLVCNSAGLFLSLNILFICSFFLTYDYVSNTNNVDVNIIILVIGVLGASFTGYLDDNTSDSSKGIKGHLGLVLKHKLTAGSIKAMVGVIISLMICSIMRYEGYNFIINFFLLSLSQNFINLMDLRPARAIKAYIVLSLICIPIINSNIKYFYINIAILISLLFYSKYELKEICIMGNTGSNVLGMVLGIIIISIDSLIFRICMLFFLMTTQIYAEKKSISVLIDNNCILKFIDLLCRKEYKNDKNKKGNCQENN